MKYSKFILVLFLFAGILGFNPNQCVAGFPGFDKALKTIKEKTKEIENAIIDQPESEIEFKTTKNNFDNYERISVEFSGLSKDQKYGSTLVEAGAPYTDMGKTGIKVLSGRSSGKTGFSGQSDGYYEVRIYPEGSLQIIARYPFTVGNPPPKAVSEENKSEKTKESGQQTTAQPESQIVFKTTKDNFDSYERISVEFSGLSEDKKYGSTLVEAGVPDTDKGKSGIKVLSGRSSGRTGFSMQDTGHYEVRIYPEGSSRVIARYPFSVGKVAPLNAPKNQQKKQVKSPAQKDVDSLWQKLQKLDELNQNANWDDQRFQGKFYSWLEGANEDINKIESKDPGFDISAYKGQYTDYKSLFDKNNAELEAAGKPREDFIKYVKTNYYALKKFFELGNGSDYYDKVKAIDYAKLLRKIDEGQKEFPDLKPLEVAPETIEEIKRFGSKYETFYDETIHNLINEMIEKAYSLKDSNANEAVKYAEEAKMLSDAAMSLLPENSKVVDLNKDAAATLDNVGRDVYAKIYTSDFHKKNAGKIVFFSSAPKIKSEDESTVKGAYKAGDFIYAMAYLKGSFKDLTKARNKIKLQTVIYVDGNEKVSHEFVMGWATVKENKTYLFMEIVPDPATNKHSGPAKFAKTLSQISPRKHVVKVVLKATTGSFLQDLAVGKFALDCSSEHDKLKEYAAKYRNKNLAENTMPDRKMKDKSLEQSMIEALKNEGWEKGKKVQRVVITGDAWEIFRHAITGVILYRKIPAAAAFKTDDGECKYWNLSFKQGYMGGSSYGKTVVGGVGSIVELSCDNVSK
ncbi:MAG: hypothetical protein ACUZ8H_00425 [Candidatus Anammoxibacter sp.]